jgi:2-polyprenyl-3-methyl-5-hydroxy-6-metoxy-1,4-benzoquinol methylase
MSDMGAYEGKPDVYFIQTRSEMFPYIADSAREILEVGCGEGSFAAALKAKREVRITAIEPFAPAAALAKSRVDTLLNLPIEEAIERLNGTSFDCIVLNDVLEHLVDPWAVLRVLVARLTMAGTVVASIPNVRYFPVLKDYFQAGEWRYASHGVLDRTHLRFFTRRSLTQLFEPSGLSLIQVQGINAIDRLPWKFSLLNRLTGGAFDDTRFRQFACVARRKEPAPDRV